MNRVTQDMTIQNRFAVLLAEMKIREKRNISLREIESIIHVPRKTLYAWEKNQVTRFDARVLDALCWYFECRPGDLLHYVEDDFTETDIPNVDPRPDY